MKKTSIKKTGFWLFWTISSKQIGLIFWLGAFLLSLRIGLYVSPTSGPMGTFLGPFEGAQMAPKWKTKKVQKTVFWLVWTISSKGMGLIIWLGACF
jgi:hypothetical protein